MTTEWMVGHYATAEAFGEFLNRMEAEGWALHSWQQSPSGWKEGDFYEMDVVYTALFRRVRVGG